MDWSRQTVLITGAGGFIGSHLTERLVALGARTRALVRYNSTGSWGWLDASEAKDDVQVFLGDVRDPDVLRDSIRGVDVVFHLAALIDAHQFLGQLEKVEKYTATLAKRHPNALEGQIALARTLLAQQRGKEVEQMLEALLESHPDSLAIKFHLAQAHMQTRRLDWAAKLLGQLEQAQPNNPAVHLALARSLAGLGRTEESLTHIQLLLDADPSNVAAHELAIRIYRLIRRPDKIAWHLHQVDSDRLDPRRQPVLAAQFKLALGQKEQAAEICRLAIEAGDRDGLLRLILSAIEERNNNRKEALAHLIEMVKAEPDTTEAYHYLRLFFTRHRQVEQGLTVFKQLESRNRTLGERIAKGEPLKEVLASATAEGYPTAKSAKALAVKLKVNTPIIDEVHAMLYEGKDVKQAVTDLTTRVPKSEN